MSPEGVVRRNVLLRMNNADYREVASESSSHSRGPRRTIRQRLSSRTEPLPLISAKIHVGLRNTEPGPDAGSPQERGNVGPRSTTLRPPLSACSHSCRLVVLFST